MNPTVRKSAQNFLLVWVDATVHSGTVDTRNTLEKLQAIVPDVRLIDHPDKAIDLLTNTDTETSFLITSGAFGQELVPHIHSLGNLAAIYIFCQNVKSHSEWSKEWTKVIDVNNRIDPICEALKQAVRHCNQDNIAMVLLDGGDANNLNELPPSFMYTTLLKDTLLNMDHDLDKEMRTFYDNALHKYLTKDIKRSDLDQFQQSYRPDQAIQWYTKKSFIYPVMNNGLRYLEGDIIVDMGFFIHDLHHQLLQRQQQQVATLGSKKFTVYRGQALPKEDLEQLQTKKDGLLGFNNFLSTSLERDRSLMFARGCPLKPGCVRVLLRMLIDPSLTRTPFADISEISEHTNEAEVLFGMHTVFRVGVIQSIADGDTTIYEIELELTADNDPQLTRLTEHMGDNIGGGCGFHRLGRILLDMNQLDKAEKIYLNLLKENPSTREKGAYNHHLGVIHYKKGNYQKALEYYQTSLEFGKQVLSENDPSLASSYSGIGLVYDNRGEYAMALSYFEKSLAIYKEKLPETNSDLASSYHNIGSVYEKIGKYQKALSYYEKSLAIQQETLPKTHPDLASSYNNIGSVHEKIGEYAKALSHYKKSLAIYQRTLPGTHPHLANSYACHGSVHDKMEEYAKALSYYEKSLAIQREILPETHPDLATSYHDIGLVYSNMGDYARALSYYEKSLAIYKETLPETHPNLANSYACHGSVYDNMGEYARALSYYEKSLTIYKETLPETHLSLALSYHNMGGLYYRMKNYSTALEYFERALRIWVGALPAEHQDIALTRQWIALIRREMNQ